MRKILSLFVSVLAFASVKSSSHHHKIANMLRGNNPAFPYPDIPYELDGVFRKYYWVNDTTGNTTGKIEFPNSTFVERVRFSSELNQYRFDIYRPKLNESINDLEMSDMEQWEITDTSLINATGQFNWQFKLDQETRNATCTTRMYNQSDYVDPVR